MRKAQKELEKLEEKSNERERLKAPQLDVLSDSDEESNVAETMSTARASWKEVIAFEHKSGEDCILQMGSNELISLRAINGTEKRQFTVETVV